MICQARLQSLVIYSPETGEFRWLENRTGSARKGSIAGRLDSKGYRQISIDGRRYGAHRLAWLYVNGKWPEHEIDHINGNRDDNRADNLRSVDRLINMRNKKRYRTASSPHAGVQHRHGSWQSYIGTSYIGSFQNFDEAVLARQNEESRLGYHTNHGRN